MPKRFIATEHAAEKGLANTTPAAGASLVADWAKELEKVDAPGVKGLHTDLIQLEKDLRKDQPDAGHIKKLLAKVGPETVKLAGKCEDPKVAEKVRSLGAMLSRSGD